MPNISALGRTVKGTQTTKNDDGTKTVVTTYTDGSIFTKYFDKNNKVSNIDYDLDGDGNADTKATYKRDDDGKILEKFINNDAKDGPDEKISYSYKNGKVDTKTTEYLDGTGSNKVEYTRDEKGQITGKKVYKNGSKTPVEYTYERDESGKVKSKTVTKNGVKKTFTYTRDSKTGRITEAKVSKNGKEDSVVKYDYEDGKIKTATTYSADGNTVKKTVTYTRDPKTGKITTKSVDSNNDNKVDDTYTYKRDIFGRLINKTYDKGNDKKIDSETNYKRDIYGRVTEKSVTQSGKTTKTTYEYGKDGKITETVVNPNGSRTVVEKDKDGKILSKKTYDKDSPEIKKN